MLNDVDLEGAARTRRPPGAILLLAFVLLVAGLMATATFVGAKPSAAALPGTPPGCDWSLLTSPNVDVYNSLDALAPVAPNNVWALGASGPDDPSQAVLVEHWDGLNWSVVSAPSPGNFQDKVLDAEALAANNVWAVGYYNGDTGGTSRSMVLHWDGTAWSQSPSPNPGVLRSDLCGLAAASANDMWAVGNSWTAGLPRMQVILHWDGTVWSSVGGMGEGYLIAADATAANDVWAVGHTGETGTVQNLVLHWNGLNWSTVPSPNVAGADNYLNSVAALAANDVWAVGYSCVHNCEGNTLTRALTMHWDGVAWSIVPVPDLGNQYNALSAVAATGSGDVWAVGVYNTASLEGHNLRLHWSGQVPAGQWSVVPGPDPESCCPGLHALAAVPGTEELWAAGDYHFPGNPVIRTQVEHYAPCGTGTVTPVPPSPTSAAATATATVSVTDTSTPAETPTRTATTTTATATVTPLVTPQATSTPCLVSFGDVSPTDYFYAAVSYLYCRGAISGYSDGTFRPYNNTTRGQVMKIIVLADSFPINTAGGPHFTDVPASNPFYAFIETAYNRRIVSGYSDGTFRWGAYVTRGQLSKIVMYAQDWPTTSLGGPHFTDVPTSHPFYIYIETIYNHGVIAGYSDGTFRPNNNATRGQISKIVYLAITGDR